MTVEEIVRAPFERDCWKRGLAPDAAAIADERINTMSNVELLREISEAIERRIIPQPPR